MNRSTDYDSNSRILGKYQELLNHKEINENDLPPAFKYIKESETIRFIYNLHDVKHLKSLIPMEKHNLFRAQNFDLADCKIDDEELRKEARYLSILQTNKYYMHQIWFFLDDKINLCSKYMVEQKEVIEAAGKTLRKLPWVKEKSDKNIEYIVNQLKAYYAPDLTFKKVKGNDIKYWYHGDQYATKAGTLSNSCMRSSACQEYLDIYTNNDVEMLIAIDTDNKLHGRALLWPRSMWNMNYFEKSNYIMDRIYGTEVTINRFINFAKENNWVYKKYQNFSDNRTFIYDNGDGYSAIDKKMKMNLDSIDFCYYPYVDTFNTLVDYDNFGLKNFGDGDKLTDTGGGTESRNGMTCIDCGHEINEDDARWIDDDAYCDDCVVYSEYDDRDYRNDDTTYSETLSTYIHTDDAIEITHGGDAGQVTHIDEIYYCYNNNYYVIPRNHVYPDRDFTPAIFNEHDELCLIRIETLENTGSSGRRFNIHTIDIANYMSSAPWTRNWSRNANHGTLYYRTPLAEPGFNQRALELIASTNTDFDEKCWGLIYKYIYGIWCRYGIKSINIQWSDEDPINIVIDNTNYFPMRNRLTSGEIVMSNQLDLDTCLELQSIFDTQMTEYNTTMSALAENYPLINNLTEETNATN